MIHLQAIGGVQTISSIASDIINMHNLLIKTITVP